MCIHTWLHVLLLWVILLSKKLEKTCSSFFLNDDGAMHFIYSHKYDTNSAEDSSDMN